MMTEDHVFIDSLGHVVHGGEAVRVGWRSYCVLYPDYWVSHEEIFSAGDRIAIIGAAGGTIAAVGGGLLLNTSGGFPPRGSRWWRRV